MRHFLVFLSISLAPLLTRADEAMPRAYYQVLSEETDESLEGKTKLIGNLKETRTNNVLGHGWILQNALPNRDTSDVQVQVINGRANEEGVFEIVFDPGLHSFQVGAQSYLPLNFERTYIANQVLYIEFNLEFDEGTIEIMPAKPVIYLYPEKELEVSVELDFSGAFGFTYPEYGDGWEVTAHPDGTLKDANGSYEYLFWDGKMDISPLTPMDLGEGQIVSKSKLVGFFEKTLRQMGLSDRERNDFITYWVPVLQEEEQYFIHFLMTEEYGAKIAGLKVTPEPESLLRLYMFFQPVEAEVKLPVKPQKFSKFKRSGFTVVEWGGSELPVPVN